MILQYCFAIHIYISLLNHYPLLFENEKKCHWNTINFQLNWRDDKERKKLNIAGSRNLLCSAWIINPIVSEVIGACSNKIKCGTIVCLQNNSSNSSIIEFFKSRWVGGKFDLRSYNCGNCSQFFEKLENHILRSFVNWRWFDLQSGFFQSLHIELHPNTGISG